MGRLAASVRAGLREQGHLWRDLPWLLGRVGRAAPWSLAAWGLLTLLRAAVVGANLWAIHGAVNALARAGGPGAASPLPWLTTLAVVFIAGRLADPLEAYVRESVRLAAGAQLQAEAQEKTLGLPVEAFDDPSVQDRIHRVAEGADRRGPELVAEALSLWRTLPEIVAYGLAAALIAPWLPLVLLAAAVLLVRRLMRAGARVRALEVERTRDRRLADYYARLLTTRGSAAEVRLFGLREELLRRWRDTESSYLGERLRLMVRNAADAAAGNAGLTVLLCGSLLALVLLRSRVAPGSAALVLTAIGGLVNSVARLAFSGREFVDHAGYARDLRVLLLELPDDGARALSGAPSAPTHLAFPHPLRRGLRLEAVGYRYRGADRDALCDLHAEIAAGSVVALVGPNGAGKSTLAHLLCGLRRPSSGRILADGVDLTRVAPGEVRRHCAAVFQHPLRLPARVAENVAAGAADVAALDGVQRALAAAGLDLSAQAGPAVDGAAGLLLGPEFGGCDLSGGQWQRLAIARGLYRADADLLVFDEPTAALDPLAELALFERFAAMAAGRTALLIAHRLGPTRLADQVLVLEGGRLVEQGPPARLLAAGGHFARMFAAQAEWYR